MSAVEFVLLAHAARKLNAQDGLSTDQRCTGDGHPLRMANGMTVRQVSSDVDTLSDAHGKLEAMAAERSNLTLYPLFSDEGDFARSDVAKERLPGTLTDYEYFICGPKPMVEGLMKDLRTEGVKRKAIHVEAFEFR